MAVTVIEAFDEFMRHKVDLDADAANGARASRDWLLGQIHDVPLRHADFPRLYPEVDIHYGSFARRTKIRELDDIDMIVGIRALGSTYQDWGATTHLHVPDGIALRGLCHDGTSLLNSRKLINQFTNALSEVPQYEKAEISRRGVAAVLSLKSYSWSFDIVPGFFTAPESDGRTFYIIPDGKGHWMKSDPRRDRDRLSAINLRHEGHVLRAIRLVKYWNKRPTMPTIPSYLLECMVADYYGSRAQVATSYVDIEFGPILNHLQSAVFSDVQDPKGVQGNLNDLSFTDRRAISSRAGTDSGRAAAARAAEQASAHQTSIRLWREILGPDFPFYG